MPGLKDNKLLVIQWRPKSNLKINTPQEQVEIASVEREQI